MACVTLLETKSIQNGKPRPPENSHFVVCMHVSVEDHMRYDGSSSASTSAQRCRTTVSAWRCRLQPWCGWQRGLLSVPRHATRPPLPSHLYPRNPEIHTHIRGTHIPCLHTYQTLTLELWAPEHTGNYGHIVGTSWFQLVRAPGLVLTSLFMSFSIFHEHTFPLSLTKWGKKVDQFQFSLF